MIIKEHAVDHHKDQNPNKKRLKDVTTVYSSELTMQINKGQIKNRIPEFNTVQFQVIFNYAGTSYLDDIGGWNYFFIFNCRDT